MKSYMLSKNSGIADEKQKKILIVAGAILVLVLWGGISMILKSVAGDESGTAESSVGTQDNKNEEVKESVEAPTGEQIEDGTKNSGENDADSKSKAAVATYTVSRVVDGDTIDVLIDGSAQRVRLIGVNTPETVDPNSPQECFGREASDFMKSLLAGKSVSLEADSSQTDRDKYGRLLRYVYLGSENVNLKLISEGYAYEYTYNVPYKYQAQFKNAQREAEAANRGLWSPNTCNGQKTAVGGQSDGTANNGDSTGGVQPVQTRPAQTQECTIKGNISNKGEKIYHVPGQRYYDATKIDASKGERMFCTEAEAVAAGWRKSKV